jgi:transcriptional regulator with XRE-family HTH domain
MKYGKAIRICRTAHGKSQGELAKDLGITPSQLSLIESERRPPSLQILTNASRALGIPPSLMALLASEPSDLEAPERQQEISAAATSLLRLLVHASHTQD